jgi:Uncharacterized protein conserved in bacteria (DUF2252)
VELTPFPSLPVSGASAVHRCHVSQKVYEWLDAANGAALPKGPPIWICGDCHVGNLGPVADAEGRVEIEIRTSIRRLSANQSMTSFAWDYRLPLLGAAPTCRGQLPPECAQRFKT